MKKRNKRYLPEQIVKKLRDAEVMLNGEKSIEEVLKILEVSEVKFHGWRLLGVIFAVCVVIAGISAIVDWLVIGPLDGRAF